MGKEWLIQAVPTKHTKPLDGKCFGYQLNVDGCNVVYTGDSETLEPFVPMLCKGSVVYAEVATFRSDVHLFLEDMLPIFNDLINNGINVYLMHLDREDVVNEMIESTLIKLAPLYERSEDNNG